MRAGISTFSSAVMPSRRLKNWNTMPMCCRRMIANSLSVLPTSASPATDDLALVGHVEAGDDVEQRRLATSGWAHHGDELAAADVEVGPAQRANRRGVLLERAEHLTDVDDERLWPTVWSSSAGSLMVMTLSPGCRPQRLRVG